MTTPKLKIGEERECPSGREMWTGRKWVPSGPRPNIVGENSEDFDKAFDASSRLEPGCSAVNGDFSASLAVSTKRAADALERIADALAKQVNTAADIFNMVEKL